MIPALLLAAAACLPVAGERVTAGDLARLEPAFGALSSDTPLGYAPAPGARRIFHRAELLRLAARYGVTLPPGDGLCVSRPLERLEKSRVLEAMRAALGSLQARVEIVELAAFAVPPGELEFPRSLLSRAPRNDPARPVLWRGHVRTAAGRSYPVWARVRVTVPCRRVIALEPLPAGRPILASQMRQEEFEACPWDEPPPVAAAELAGKAPRRLIPAGAPVTREAVQAPPDVERGDMVQVEALRGRARVEAAARAESAGARGQVVSLRNLESGRRFRATVTGKGRAVVRESSQGGAQR